MKCPKCSSPKSVKNGIVRKKQRYKCLRCGTNYTIKYTKKTANHFKRISFILSLSGYSNRDIAEFIGVSHTTVNDWLGEKSLLKMIRQQREEPRIKLFISKKEELSDTQNKIAYHNWFQIRWNATDSQTIAVKRRKPWGGKHEAQIERTSKVSALQRQMKAVLLTSKWEENNISSDLIGAIDKLNRMLNEYVKYTE